MSGTTLQWDYNGHSTDFFIHLFFGWYSFVGSFFPLFSVIHGLMEQALNSFFFIQGQWKVIREDKGPFHEPTKLEKIGRWSREIDGSRCHKEDDKLR